MGNWSKSLTYLAVALLAGGFVAIVLGWNGAAGLDRVPGQLPFLISGGLAGLALVIVGAALAVVQELRRATVRVLQKLEEVGSVAAAAAGPTVVPDDENRVVAGRTTYHRPECHLVEGRTDLQIMAPQAAHDRGLAACRICKPVQVEASA